MPSTNTKIEAFIQHATDYTLRVSEPMSKHTTFRIGGPAELFVTVESIPKLIKIVRLAQSFGVCFFILGEGSNILVTDKGIGGLVIRNRSRTVVFPNISQSIEPNIVTNKTSHSIGLPDQPTETRDLVVVDSGVSLPSLIKKCLACGYTGLHWFAGIPGTVGGALYNNVHGVGHNLSEFIEDVEVMDSHGDPYLMSVSQLGLGYDRSIFRQKRELVITRIQLRLERGDVAEAEHILQTWLERKKGQKGRSTGCVFANISEYQRKKAGLPCNSVGYINDKLLHMNGTRIGDAMLGKFHGNFITNEGHATAAEVLSLMKMVRKKYRKSFGIRLRSEINIVGKRD